MLIGEVSGRSGVSARMLRHYESLGLLRPAGRGAGGYRSYSEEDLRRILHIESLRSLGLTLQEVGAVLEDPDFDPRELLTELIGQSRRRLAEERELLRRLRAVRAAEPGDWTSVLGVVELLQGLRSTEASARQRTAFLAGAAGVGEEAVPGPELVDSALREPHPNVAGALSWAARQSGAVAGAARGLRSADPEVRSRAVRMLATTAGDAEAAAALRSVCEDPDPEVRSLAVLAVAGTAVAGDPQLIEWLITMVIEGHHDVEAAELLAPASAGSAVPLMERFARELESREKTDPARSRITQALAEFPGAGELLASLSSDPDPAVAYTARGILRVRGAGPGGG